jgi:hypothetical protein
MNKKDVKIFNIAGIGGIIVFVLLLTLFLIVFMLFPIWGIKELWNYFVGYHLAGPAIASYQAGLLWLAGAIALLAYLKKFISVKIQKLDVEQDDEELKDFLNEMSEKDQITDEDIEKFEEIMNNKS